MKAASFVGGISAVLFGLLVACSGAAPDSTPSSKSSKSSGTGTDKNATEPTPPSSNGTPPAGNADTPPPPASGNDATCAQKGDACFTCCIDNHPKGEQVFDDALFGCLCAADKCATQCAQSACNQANPSKPTDGDACATCLAQYTKDDGSGACDKVAEPACKADADCTAEGKCMDACPQQ